MCVCVCVSVSLCVCVLFVREFVCVHLSVLFQLSYQKRCVCG